MQPHFVDTVIDLLQIAVLPAVLTAKPATLANTRSIPLHRYNAQLMRVSRIFEPLHRVLL